MVILDPSLDERTVAPSLDTYLNVVRQDGGQVESVDVWGKRRLAYEIDKNAEGIYAVDRKSTRLNSSHANISYAVFCLKKKHQADVVPLEPVIKTPAPPRACSDRGR